MSVNAAFAALGCHSEGVDLPALPQSRPASASADLEAPASQPHQVNMEVAPQQVDVSHNVNESEDNRPLALRYTVPRAKEAELVTTLEQLQVTAGVTETTLGLNTLEAVFLTIAKQAEIEEAMQSGKQSKMMTTVEVEHETLLKGVAKVTVTVGSDAELVELVVQGGQKKWFVCAIEWGQDEDGSFSIVETKLKPASADEIASMAQAAGAPAPSEP